LHTFTPTIITHMEKHLRQACVDCHFFVNRSEIVTAVGTQIFNSPVEDTEREAARRNDFEWAREDIDSTGLQCHFLVWHASTAPGGYFQTIIKTERKGFCFFWPYHPGMLLAAAETLQRREVEDEKTQGERRLTRWGVWIAAGALLVNLIYPLLKDLVFPLITKKPPTP